MNILKKEESRYGTVRGIHLLKLIFSAESKNNDIKFFSQLVVDGKTVLTTEFSSQKIDREYAREVLMILCKEKVDPIHLASIIEDIEADL